MLLTSVDVVAGLINISGTAERCVVSLISLVHLICVLRFFGFPRRLRGHCLHCYALREEYSIYGIGNRDTKLKVQSPQGCLFGDQIDPAHP